MATGSISNLLWIVALIAGWLAIICLIGGRYAGAKFQTLLKAPLSEEVEHLTQFGKNVLIAGPHWAF